MYYQTLTDSIKDENGKIIFYGVKDFKNIICSGNNCFICGSERNSKPFNDEHVIPRWILSKYNLFNRDITLTNGTSIRYSSYTIPCCVECNSFLNDNIEMPMNSLLSNDYHDMVSYIADNSPWLMIIWLSLIYFKTHYKDIYLKYERDKRLGNNLSISDIYDWESIHHIYCLARSIYAHASYSIKALPSFFMSPALIENENELFDYSDLYICKSVMIRIGDRILISVLNDGCFAWNYTKELISKIDGRLSFIQIKELFSYISYCNTLINNRPSYSSNFDLENSKYIIEGELPDLWDIKDFNYREYGLLLDKFVYDLFKSSPPEERFQIKNNLLSGKVSFILDKKGNFINYSNQSIIT